MTKHFISEAITPSRVVTSEELPPAFAWRDELLEVKAVRNKWRSTKEDRGDVYLKRHWFEFETTGSRIVTVYFDRAAKRGRPRWWLYAIDD